MTAVPIINMAGETGEKVKLRDEIFGVQPNPVLQAQAIRVFLANQRKAVAKTKSRGMVAKTTAKMYRQKGTGRARHGSYSAPIFVGGGITFGPTGEQNYKLSLSKIMSRKALSSTLSEKVKDHKVMVLTYPEKLNDKTREANKLLDKLLTNKEQLLLIASSKENAIYRIFRNQKNVTMARPNQLNTFLILKNNQVLFTHQAVEELVKLFVKN